MIRRLARRRAAMQMLQALAVSPPPLLSHELIIEAWLWRQYGDAVMAEYLARIAAAVNPSLDT